MRGYRSFQADESKLLIRDILEDPDEFVMSIERYSVSITSIVGWGRSIARLELGMLTRCKAVGLIGKMI